MLVRIKTDLVSGIHHLCLCLFVSYVMILTQPVALCGSWNDTYREMKASPFLSTMSGVSLETQPCWKVNLKYIVSL